MSRRRVLTCSNCGLSGEELERVGFTYYKGELLCLSCYRKISGVKALVKPTEEYEEEVEEVSEAEEEVEL